MTSKFTPRIGHGKGAETGSPSLDSAKPSPDPTGAEIEKTAAAETAEAQPPVAGSNPDPSGADKPGVATPPEATVTQNDSPALTAIPARPVEEKPKAARAKASAARMWLSNAQAYRMPVAAAAALVLALGSGYGLGAAGRSHDGVDAGKTAQLLETTARDLREAHGQIGQLAAELKSIKGAVEGIKGDREKSRSDILVKQAQLSERVERAGQDSVARIGKLAEQLDRIERGQREAARQAAAEKTDRTEKREKVAAAPPPPPIPPVKPGLVPPPKPHPDPAHTGSIGDPKATEKPDPRKTPLDGYVVRDYDDGFALVETRAGRYIDVAVGYNLPGVGRVEAIERRGRQWVVITPKGYIGER